MKIAVCICTFNRANLLRQTLARMCELEMPRQTKIEFIVIDNNSTDETAIVIKEFASLLPISTVFEPTPGLSNARNCAIDCALSLNCDYIIWTDDDVLPAKDWLIQYERGYISHPEAAIFGGTVEPWFAVTPPKWLVESWPLLKHAYAVRELGDKKFQLQAVGSNIPFGANFSIRTKEQITAKYDPNMGVIGKNRLAGEETSVIRNLLLGGATGWWLPEAKVKHYLEPDRLTLSYIGKYHRGYGVSLSRQAAMESSSSLRFINNIWIFRVLVKSILLFTYHFLRGDVNQYMTYYMDGNVALGRVIYMLTAQPDFRSPN